MVVYRLREPLEAKELLEYFKSRGYSVVVDGAEEMETCLGFTFQMASFYLTKGDDEVLITVGDRKEKIEETFGALPKRAVYPANLKRA